VSFFRNMGLWKGVLLCCLIGSVPLGVLDWLKYQRLGEVKTELVRVKDLVKEIQTDALRLDQLQRSASTDKFKQQDAPETYIRAIAGEDVVAIGQVDISKKEKTPARGIEDTIYTISPQSKTQRCTRHQVGNFLYRLEQGSPRVKVTRLKLSRLPKVNAGEIGKDEWMFEVDLTTRAKVDTGRGDQG
jgi:hypothetical protein